MSGTYGSVDVSHDGRFVAYIAGSPTGPELRVVDVANAATTVLERNARAPRWSAQGDRLAYLIPGNGPFSSLDGVPVVVNVDGSGRRVLSSEDLIPGLAWSPDGMYLVGRAGDAASRPALRLLRVSDGASVLLHFRSPTGATEDYLQPDWR
jgi:Tol biopolymer transport system component